MRKSLAVTSLVVLATIALLVSVFYNPVNAEESTSITTAELNAIKENCATIHDNLKNVQYEDSRVRVHLGRYYETILTNFITPLNATLVSNNTPNVSLIENQSNFVSTRDKFSSDYITYQKNLEELVSIDCSVEPLRFYNKLVSVREMRAKVATDTTKLRELSEKQVTLVTKLKEILWVKAVEIS